MLREFEKRAQGVDPLRKGIHEQKCQPSLNTVIPNKVRRQPNEVEGPRACRVRQGSRLAFSR